MIYIGTLSIKKKILIIGAGGSIGTKIYEKVLNLNPSKIVLLDYLKKVFFYFVYIQFFSQTCIQTLVAKHTNNI